MDRECLPAYLLDEGLLADGNDFPDVLLGVRGIDGDECRRRVGGEDFLTQLFALGFDGQCSLGSNGEWRRLGSGRLGSGRLGSGRLGSGRLGSGRLGSGRLGSGRLGSGRLGSGRLGSGRLGSGRLGSGRLGSGRLGSGRLGSGRLGSGRLGSGRLGSGRLGSGRLGSGRLGSLRCAVGEDDGLKLGVDDLDAQIIGHLNHALSENGIFAGQCDAVAEFLASMEEGEA